MSSPVKQHYILAERPTRRGLRGAAAKGMVAFRGTDAKARAKVLRLSEVFDRVSWWTWVPSEYSAFGGRLRQRL